MPGKRKIIPLLAILLSLLAALQGCYVITDEVVGGESAVFVDAKLPGLWKMPGKKEYILIAAQEKDKISVQLFDGEFKADKEIYVGRTTRSGSDTFMNLQRYTGFGEPALHTGYLPAYYRLAGDKLEIALFDEGHFIKALEEKKLNGTLPVKTGTYSSTPARISSKGDVVAKFIAANISRKGFVEKWNLLERVKLE